MRCVVQNHICKRTFYYRFKDLLDSLVIKKVLITSDTKSLHYFIQLSGTYFIVKKTKTKKNNHQYGYECFNTNLCCLLSLLPNYLIRSNNILFFALFVIMIIKYMIIIILIVTIIIITFIIIIITITSTLIITITIIIIITMIMLL